MSRVRFKMSEPTRRLYRVEGIGRSREEKTEYGNLKRNTEWKNRIGRHRRREMGFPPKFAVLLMGFLIPYSLVKSVPNTTVISALCNGNVYTHGDPFAISLSYVLDDLKTGTPTSKNYDYYNISPYPNAFAYGHAACNRNLTGSDCETCLGSAKSYVLDFCRSRIGAREILRDCKIRYEQYPFTE